MIPLPVFIQRTLVITFEFILNLLHLIRYYLSHGALLLAFDFVCVVYVEP
jgi:hypothetical protein